METTLKISNGNLQDILNKKNNLWLGVSVSLKPYSGELAKKYLKFLIKNTKEKAVVFIADKIAAINYHALDKMSLKASLRKAYEDGDNRVKEYEKLIQELSKKDQEKIEIMRWDDIWNEKLEDCYNILKEEYNSDKEFKKEVEAPIKLYLEKRGRTPKEKIINQMIEYILKELPFLLNGFTYKNKEYKTLLYPTYSDTTLASLSEEIQQGKRFQEIKKKLNLKGDHILCDSYVPQDN